MSTITVVYSKQEGKPSREITAAPVDAVVSVATLSAIVPIRLLAEDTLVGGFEFANGSFGVLHD